MLKQGFLALPITFRIGIALKNLANRVGNPCLCTLQWVVYVGSVDVIGLSLWGGSHVLCAFEMSKQLVHRAGARSGERAWWNMSDFCQVNKGSWVPPKFIIVGLTSKMTLEVTDTRAISSTPPSSVLRSQRAASLCKCAHRDAAPQGRTPPLFLLTYSS